MGSDNGLSPSSSSIRKRKGQWKATARLLTESEFGNWMETAEGFSSISCECGWVRPLQAERNQAALAQAAFGLIQIFTVLDSQGDGQKGVGDTGSPSTFSGLVRMISGAAASRCWNAVWANSY